MKEFYMPFKEKYGAQKWCVNLHNKASSKKLNGGCPLEISEGQTQDISKLIFHLWEPIWYFRKCKTTENPWQPVRWMGFVHSTGYEM